MDEKDIWRTAALLIKQHGGKAGEIAKLRVIDMMEKNDADGQAVWKPACQANQQSSSPAIRPRTRRETI